MNDKLRNIINELYLGLTTLYGKRLDRVVLYGSQAKGDARPESDIDVLIVLHDDVRYGEEIRRVVPVTADISLRHNVLISCAFTSSADYGEGDEPLLINVREEGIEI